VRELGVDMHCELIGYGPMREQIETLKKALALGERVSVRVGLSHSDVVARLATVDVFVLTSSWEGMPGSVLEAMASGLPVIASNVNGTREVVADGVTGFLVPMNDAEATAEALVKLARDPKLRHRMGALGRARIQEHFSVERMVAKKERFYLELPLKPH
jgi:glycosyltransferase involved in cell wall biosynthesis